MNNNDPTSGDFDMEPLTDEDVKEIKRLFIRFTIAVVITLGVFVGFIIGNLIIKK